MKPSNSVFNLFKRTIDSTVSGKKAIAEKLKKFNENPTLIEFKEYYENNEDEIDRITEFGRSAMNYVQSLLHEDEKKRNVISYIRCADHVKTSFFENFQKEEKPLKQWSDQFCTNWVTINSFFAFVGPIIEKKYKNKVLVEPYKFEESKKKSKHDDDIGVEIRPRCYISEEDDTIILWANGGICCSRTSVENTKKLIRELAWEFWENSCTGHMTGVGSFTIGATKEDNFITSKKATEFSIHLDKFLKKGYSRSILFYGPPGTGKSNAVRNIASNLGTTTLRLNFSDISSVKPFLIEFLSIVKPDVIILEDIDHGDSSGERVLLLLELMNKNCKLLLATANDVSKLNDAIVRPERFDELHEIRTMDEEVLMGIVRGDAEIFNIVKDFPIVSTIELMKRVDVLGKEEALKSINDITQRLKNIDKRYQCKLT